MCDCAKFYRSKISRSAKYLGIELTNNLTWSTHISHVNKKANKTNAFVHRNLQGCPQSVLTTAYKSLVRPILEYASAVWDPHQKKYVEAIEAVQKRAARRTTRNFSTYSSATAIVKELGLESLSTRRDKSKLKMMHKIFNEQVAVKLPDNIQRVERRTRGHNNRLSLPRARTNAHLYSFFPSAFQLWNSLSPEAAETKCPDAFNKIISLGV